MIRERSNVLVNMRIRPRPTRALLFYASVTGLIAFSFAWQMLHGICPVP